MLATRLFVCFLAVAAASPAAHAGGRKRSVQDEARDLYKQAMTHYELGEFDVAIEEFKHAYALTSAPGLLFNIAQVYRMKKDPEQAVYFYRTYLRLLPNAPNRGDVEALISENQALVDAAAAKRSAEAQAAPPPAKAGPAAAPPAAAVAFTPAAPLPPPRRRPWRLELWSGVGVAALGVGALAAAVALGARASSDASQISSANAERDVPWDATKQQLWRDGQNSGNASLALYVAGGVVAATGAVLIAVGLRDRARVRSFAVAPSATGASLVMSCAF